MQRKLKMIRFVFSSLLIFLLLVSCTSKETPKQTSQLTSKKVVLDDIEMLFGTIDKKQLYFDYPEWKTEEDFYQPDSATIEALKSVNGRYKVDIFLGTWCSDSEREVPHFFKIIQQANLQNKLSLQLYAVNRKLKLENDLTDRLKIKRVPTFIFYQNDKEIGRIVETPNDLLEKDLLTILSKTK